ncbi:7tm Odorant receptor [Popillia japonica]|uniref:7tm Odorant receptor n=1 Tax=Popillia japonica TaxID=7064 RepID=A0AAW1MAP3_POPJA
MDVLSYSSQVVTIVFYIAQFALYTFPAEEVAFEFLDLPNAIYTSEWYNNKVEIQKLILYVMMKSQQQKYFTGAGLIDINVETFDSIVDKVDIREPIIRNDVATRSKLRVRHSFYHITWFIADAERTFRLFPSVNRKVQRINRS